MDSELESTIEQQRPVRLTMNPPLEVKVPTNQKTLFAVFCLFGLASLIMAFIFSGCGVPVIVAESVGKSALKGLEGLAGVPPESEWNSLGIWKKVENSPATYIPARFPQRSPRNESMGAWVVDKRDGKRFFVPNGGTGEMSQGVLAGEAKKITTWNPRDSSDRNPITGLRPGETY